jgi:hypothetical protein
MFVRYLNYCTSESGQVVRIIAGVLVWLAVLIMRLPEPTGRQWGEMLLLLATLLLVPLSFRWFVPLAYGWHGWLWRGLHGLQLPAALSLVVAYKCFCSGDLGFGDRDTVVPGAGIVSFLQLRNPGESWLPHLVELVPGDRG